MPTQCTACGFILLDVDTYSKLYAISKTTSDIAKLLDKDLPYCCRNIYLNSHSVLIGGEIKQTTSNEQLDKTCRNISRSHQKTS